MKSDSIDYEAAQTNQTIAQRQYERTVTLQSEGLKAMTDVEGKRLKLQETQAKLISQENKLLASRNEIINAQLEISRITAEYADKIAKSRSDRFTAESGQFEAEAQVTKLENQPPTTRCETHFIISELLKTVISIRQSKVVLENPLKRENDW